jgi:hypothetical protein
LREDRAGKQRRSEQGEQGPAVNLKHSVLPKLMTARSIRSDFNCTKLIVFIAYEQDRFASG